MESARSDDTRPHLPQNVASSPTRYNYVGNFFAVLYESCVCQGWLLCRRWFSKIMILDEGYEPNSHEAREYYDELAEVAKYYRVFTGAPSTLLKRYGITRVVPD